MFGIHESKFIISVKTLNKKKIVKNFFPDLIIKVSINELIKQVYFLFFSTE